jgi:hypothetical protein
MTSTPPTLKSLIACWGDAYLFGYTRDRWIAIRRDGLLFLPAGTLTQLEAEIESDYQKNPVLDECGPLDAASSYLTADHHGEPDDTDNLALAVREARAAEKPIILQELRALFPAWDIEYSGQAGGWIATRKNLSIGENSPGITYIALTMINQERGDG